MHRALCFSVGAKSSSNYLGTTHLYTSLPVAHLAPGGMTALQCNDVSDDDISETGELRVRYAAPGCRVSPVRDSAVKLGGRRDVRPPTDKLRRLLCCRKRDQVNSLLELLLISDYQHLMHAIYWQNYIELIKHERAVLTVLEFHHEPKTQGIKLRYRCYQNVNRFLKILLQL